MRSDVSVQFRSFGPHIAQLVVEFTDSMKAELWEVAIKKGGVAVEAILEKVFRDFHINENNRVMNFSDMINHVRAMSNKDTVGINIFTKEIAARADMVRLIRNLYAHPNELDYNTTEHYARCIEIELDVLLHWAGGAYAKLHLEALPEIVREHVTHLERFVVGRLEAALDESLLTPGDVQRLVVSRTVRNVRPPNETLVLPDGLVEALDRSAARTGPVNEMLITAGAGEGKTTLVNSLLYELAQPGNVCRWKLVPMLADCVTLSRLFPAEPSDDGDAKALEKWFALAVSPRQLGAVHPTGVAPDNERTGKFAAELAAGGFKLLLVIDGFDELDPSATIGNGDQVRRLLVALHNWQREHRIQYCYRIATTRPYFENIASLSDLREFELAPPDREEIARLAEVHGVGPSLIDRFCETFARRDGVSSKLIYLKPLVDYFREEVAGGGGDLESVTPAKLLERVVGGAVQEIKNQLRLADVRARGGSDNLDWRIRNMLVRIALGALDEKDPQRPISLSRRQIAALAQAEALPEVAELLDLPMVSAKILNVLVFERRGRSVGGREEELFYRLPHNDYRDFLLAEGLFRLILNDPLASPPEDSQTVAGLARAYGRSERVQYFLHEQVRAPTLKDVVEPSQQEFSCRVIRFMNDRLKSEGPAERSDCSAHGAMLTLLLSFDPVPLTPPLMTKGVNFHGAVVRARREERISLPGNGDWSGAVLRDADLRGADLSGLDLSGADLDNALLNGTDLTGARLVRADMRNVAMGSYHVEIRDEVTKQPLFRQSLPTVLNSALLADPNDPDSGADLFNYRFQGLQGYYCFWEIEPLRAGLGMIIAGSRGEILNFDTSKTDWVPRCWQTGHADDILDVSSHPTKPLIVTSSRDGTVRLHRLPAASDLAACPDDRPFPLQEIQVLNQDALFGGAKYPRRARFSKSGRWLAVIARDPRVMFFRIEDGGDDLTILIPGEVGRAHTGPVMCVTVDEEPLLSSGKMSKPDRFLTSGYDGRIAGWCEVESAERIENRWTTLVKGQQTIRSMLLSPSGAFKGVNDGVWIGTEKDGLLTRYSISDDGPVEQRVFIPASGVGVFSIGLEPQRNLLAVGLASGEVLVAQLQADGDIDWACPGWRCKTGDEIVRAVRFAEGGRHLHALSWDGGLYEFAIGDEGLGEWLTPVRRYVYPEDKWRPELDLGSMRVGGSDFSCVKGLSDRMKRYLLMLGRAAEADNAVVHH